MKKLILILTLVFAQVSFAHEQDEANEAKQELQMVQQELAAGFERIALLQNSILNADIDAAKKCAYISELKNLIIQVGYMVDQFQSVQMPNDEAMFEDDSASLRVIFAEQMRSRLEITARVIPTFETNNSCQQ